VKYSAEAKVRCRSFAAGVLCALTVAMTPVAAEPEDAAPIKTHEGRVIANPDSLAPPRDIPLEQSIPSVAEPQLDQELLHLDLRQAMSRVLAVTPSLQKVQSRIRQAEYRVDQAYTLVNPKADFSTQYSRVEPPVSFPGGAVISPADNYQFSLVLRQAIYTFGRLKWNVLAGKLGKRVVQEEYRTELNRLIFLVAQRYIEALISQEQVVNAEDNFEAQLASLRRSELLFEQGVAAQFDVLRNSAAASQAQQTLIEARTNEAVAKSRLMSLLNEPLNRKLQLDALQLTAPKDDFHLAEAKLKALESRPDLRSLRWAVEEAKAKIEVAETENNPYLELQNTTINRNATGFSPGTQNTTAIVLNVPLFDGGVSHLQKEQAVESVKQLIYDLEQAERNVVLQVDETYRQLMDRWKAISVAEQNVVQSEEAHRVAILRYENGISTNVELLNSQSARAIARFELARAKADFLLSRWTWWQATAGEYPTEVPMPPEIRARLDAEGLPDGEEIMSDRKSGTELGPLLPVEAAPALPIRGLPKREPGDDNSSPSENLDKE
jgi:outer membrane protein TolC